MFPLAFNDTDLSVFSTGYEQARQQLLQQLAGLEGVAEHRVFSLPETGPEGEALCCDVLWLGARNARRVLVSISATHGVEGFVGSAIQLDSLKRWQAAERAQSEVAYLLIHALNPWGFAWLRRCDQEGIDLNRNFIDFTCPPTNLGYRELASAIVPETTDWTAANQRLSDYLVKHGQRRYELAVSGGQYEFPMGVFYGGAGPSKARQWIETLFAEFGLAERQLAVVDIHSGLGPYGYGELICDHALTSDGLRTAQRWYGDSVTVPEEGTSSSVPKSGLLDYAWHGVMSVKNSCYITLEFGTYALNSLFDTLRMDHRLHLHPIEWHDAHTQQVKAAIKRHFYPAEPQWNTLVLHRGRQVLSMAIQGLLNNE